MSERDGEGGAWVGDMDAWFSYDVCRDEEIYVEREHRHELAEKLYDELDELGEIKLLAGKAISARELNRKGISPSEWRHALHKSKMGIGTCSGFYDDLNGIFSVWTDRTESLETRFLKAMLNLGRPYAIARYARWERLDYPSALTATFPHGIRALVNQLLAFEGITRTREIDTRVRTVLDPCEKIGMTAYSRTGMLRAVLHRVANDTPNHPGGPELNRDRMRTMLSLVRLYFSTVEIKMTSVEELRLLFGNYELEREAARRDDLTITRDWRFIRSWRLRHIQPLVNLYPYSIRNGLQRALACGGTEFYQTDLENELALAHCGIYRMRDAGKARAISSKK